MNLGMKQKNEISEADQIQQKIIHVRGVKVILDRDLASLYDVSTKALNQAVKRNRERFPSDFIFKLTQSEKTEVVTNCDRLTPLKYSSTTPWVFTEHGAIMMASLLNSKFAIEVSVFVVRAFVHFRKSEQNLAEILDKLDLLESKVGEHDQKIMALIDSFRRLLGAKDEEPKRQIGFQDRR